VPILVFERGDKKGKSLKLEPGKRYVFGRDPALEHERRRPGHRERVAHAPIRRAVHDDPLGAAAVGGIHHREGASLDPLRFTTALASRACRHGATIRLGSAVLAVEARSGPSFEVVMADGVSESCDALVLATGPFSLGILKRFGLTLPIQPGKGYHIDVQAGPPGAPTLEVPCVLMESSVFCTPMGRFVRFAGTMEFSGENDLMRRARLEQIARAARSAFPALGLGPPRSEWCGLRPMSADGLPIVGAVPGVPGLFVATGHGMLGLTFGPLTGSILAEQVLRGEVGAEGWTPARFSR